MSAAKLVELKQRFLQGSADRVSSLSRALEMVSSDRLNTEAFDQLKRGLHGLAGLAGTHGFHQITAIARTAETALTNELREGNAVHQQISAAIDQIRLEFTRGISIIAPGPQARVSRGNVLVVDHDQIVTQKLARNLAAEGFSFRTATTLAEARKLIDESVPDDHRNDPGGRQRLRAGRTGPCNRSRPSHPGGDPWLRISLSGKSAGPPLRSGRILREADGFSRGGSCSAQPA